MWFYIVYFIKNVKRIGYCINKYIIMLYNVIALLRRLLPVQLNTDEHDPKFCRDNFVNFTQVNKTAADILCPLSADDFEGAPPTVTVDMYMHSTPCVCSLLCTCSEYSRAQFKILSLTSTQLSLCA